MKFAGYTKVYDNRSEKNVALPALEEGDEVKLTKSDNKQHFTQPPARYTEASLVRALEENGVGRPSTYAPTIQNIQSRNYVKLEGRAIMPTELGEIVDGLVEQFFPDITSVDYTAKLEDELDEVEEGKKNWVSVVDQYYKPFSKDWRRRTARFKRSRSRTSQLVLTARSAERRCWSRWAAMVSSTAAPVSRIAATPRPS